nr:MAG TPA: hypothetical protein [Caudoviricetes sp.]
MLLINLKYNNAIFILYILRQIKSSRSNKKFARDNLINFILNKPY